MPGQNRRVAVIDQRTGTMTNVKLPANVAMKKLVPVLVKRLGLPLAGPGGEEQVYFLAFDNIRNNEHLDDNETLEDADVEDGAVLRIVPHMTSGPAEASTRYNFLRGSGDDQLGDGIANRTLRNRYRILFLAADPTDAARLRLGEELREIQEELLRAKLRDEFYLAQRMSVPAARISQAILDEKPNIVHFSGHGLNSGELCFEDIVGQLKPVAPAALAALFKLVSHQVQCVLLNACYSDQQAKAISSWINYVIGTEKGITEQAAVSFATGFYRALGAGEPVEKAYEFGCVQIRLQCVSDSSLPILLKKTYVR